MFVTIQNTRQQEQFEHAGGPLLLGRSPEHRTIANRQIRDLTVSRYHLRIEPLSEAGGFVRLHNISEKVSVTIRSDPPRELDLGESIELPLPVLLQLGNSQVGLTAEKGPLPAYVLDSTSAAESDARREDDEPKTVQRPVQSVRLPAKSMPIVGASPSPETLLRWFETVVGVQRAAAGSNAFFAETARAVVELVGLERGLVILRQDQQWNAVAHHGKPGKNFSHTILERVAKEQRTFFLREETALPTDSLRDVSHVVCSPILNPAEGAVVGAIYGSRTAQADDTEKEVTSLEAQLVQVLAAAVGSGLSRLDQEAEATRRLVQFEQFFSPQLARELDRDPRMLEGRRRDVSVLFSDLRGFSRLSERLEPTLFWEVIHDVMDCLTDEIRQTNGVVVEYMGDGILAMWNAPTDQPAHAESACEAALAMRARLPELNARWEARLKTTLELGVGICSGVALVGNVGSRYRFKYGAMGKTINLASRLEGATKQISVPILISAETAATLPERYAIRRLGNLQLVGLQQPVEVYELRGSDAEAGWQATRAAFEEGLTAFERGEWRKAQESLRGLIASSEADLDGPTLTLASRTLAALRNPPKKHDPVWRLEAK